MTDPKKPPERHEAVTVQMPAARNDRLREELPTLPPLTSSITPEELDEEMEALRHADARTIGFVNYRHIKRLPFQFAQLIHETDERQTAQMRKLEQEVGLIRGELQVERKQSTEHTEQLRQLRESHDDLRLLVKTLQDAFDATTRSYEESHRLTRSEFHARVQELQTILTRAESIAKRAEETAARAAQIAGAEPLPGASPPSKGSG